MTDAVTVGYWPAKTRVSVTGGDNRYDRHVLVLDRSPKKLADHRTYDTPYPPICHFPLRRLRRNSRQYGAMMKKQTFTLDKEFLRKEARVGWDSFWWPVTGLWWGIIAFRDRLR